MCYRENSLALRTSDKLQRLQVYPEHPLRIRALWAWNNYYLHFANEQADIERSRNWTKGTLLEQVGAGKRQGACYLPHRVVERIDRDHECKDWASPLGLSQGVNIVNTPHWARPGGKPRKTSCIFDQLIVWHRGEKKKKKLHSRCYLSPGDGRAFCNSETPGPRSTPHEVRDAGGLRALPPCSLGNLSKPRELLHYLQLPFCPTLYLQGNLNKQ